MFIGHYAAALAARPLARDVPLWAFVGAAQLLDILWCVFIILGVETVQANPTVTEGLAFTSYPYSHSLAASVAWALIAGFAWRVVFRSSAKGAALIGTVVASHWPLDLLVHRADLPLWPGDSAKLGLGIWNYPVAELTLELFLLAAAGAVAALQPSYERPERLRLAWFLMFGTLFMIAMRQLTAPAEVDPQAVGGTGLALYVGFILLAWLVEKPGRRGNAHSPHGSRKIQPPDFIGK
jgi:membrane-bound metal-dependent hydrolase YbcI (DUF457 family)